MIKIDEFLKLYNSLTLKKGGSLYDLLDTVNFKNALYRSKDNTTSDIFTFPNIRQSDARIVKLKLALFYDVCRKYPIYKGTDPLPPGFIDGNITKLLSTTTHVVESGIPGISEEIRKTHFEEAGLQMSYDPQDYEYLKEYTEFLYSYTKPTNVRIPLDSNRGLGTNGVDKLKSITDPIYGFKAIMAMKAKGLLDSGDYTKMQEFLWNEASINLFGTVIQRRQARNTKLYNSRDEEIVPYEEFQNISKEKFISDFLDKKYYASAKPRKIFDPKVGNRDAFERPLEDRIFVDGKNREAENISSVINKFGNLITKPVPSTYKEEFKETFKFRSIADENQQIIESQNRVFISHDVNKYDRNFTDQDYEIIRNALSKAISPHAAIASDLSRGFGVIFPYKGKVYISNQKQPVSTMMSGSPRTSTDGATKNSGIQMLSHGVPKDKDHFKMVLQWKPNPNGSFKNNSDDALDGFPNIEKKESFVEKYDKQNKYFKVEAESSCVYSGKCLHLVGENKFSWTDTPSSVLVNILVREYSFGYFSEYDGKLIGSKPYSTMGYMYKRDSDNPTLRDLINLLESNFFEIFQFDLWRYLQKYLKFPQLIDLSEIEKQYLLDPSIVSWKLTAAEVDTIRPELIEDSYITFDKEVIAYIYENL